MPDEMPENLAAFGIGSGKKNGLRELFSSHPPLDQRIEALQRGINGQNDKRQIIVDQTGHHGLLGRRGVGCRT